MGLNNKQGSKLSPLLFTLNVDQFILLPKYLKSIAIEFECLWERLFV